MSSLLGFRVVDLLEGMLNSPMSFAVVVNLFYWKKSAWGVYMGVCVCVCVWRDRVGVCGRTFWSWNGITECGCGG